MAAKKKQGYDEVVTALTEAHEIIKASKAEIVRLSVPSKALATYKADTEDYVDELVGSIETLIETVLDGKALSEELEKSTKAPAKPASSGASAGSGRSRGGGRKVTASSAKPSSAAKKKHEVEVPA